MPTGMARFTVVYDANILYPAPLRDLRMRLAMTDMFRARWTNDIHDEWIRKVLKIRHDLTRTQLERTRELMNAHVRDCVVFGNPVRMARWRELMKNTNNAERRRWARFVSRVLKPLCLMLEQRLL